MSIWKSNAVPQQYDRPKADTTSVAWRSWGSSEKQTTWSGCAECFASWWKEKVCVWSDLTCVSSQENQQQNHPNRPCLCVPVQFLCFLFEFDYDCVVPPLLTVLLKYSLFYLISLGFYHYMLAMDMFCVCVCIIHCRTYNFLHSLYRYYLVKYFVYNKFSSSHPSSKTH